MRGGRCSRLLPQPSYASSAHHYALAVALVGDAVERTAFLVEPVAAVAGSGGGAPLRIHYVRMDGATLVLHTRNGVADGAVLAAPSPLPVLQRLCTLASRLRRSLAMASGGLLSVTHAALAGFAAFGEAAPGTTASHAVTGFDDVEGLTGSAAISSAMFGGPAMGIPGSVAVAGGGGAAVQGGLRR